MQQLTYRQESCPLLFCFLFFVLGIGIFTPSRAIGQVIIKERMELNSFTATGSEADQNFTNTPQVGQWFFHPVLHSLGDGHYLVLKTGHLKLYAKQAAAYRQGDRSDHAMQIEHNKSGVTSDTTVFVTDHLIEPLTVTDQNLPSCPGPFYSFEDTGLYSTRRSVDTYISNGSDAENLSAVSLE